jgi:hypothetical protein
MPPHFCYDHDVWKRVAVKQGRSFLQHVIPAIIKPLRALWNEVIGFLFLCMGTIFGFSAFRSLRAGDDVRGFVMCSSAILMAYFGVSSFLRARKISRS